MCKNDVSCLCLDCFLLNIQKISFEDKQLEKKPKILVSGT